MNHQRVPRQTPMAPQQAPIVPATASQASPFLALQGMIGNAGVLDLLRSQMSQSPRELRPSVLPNVALRVLRRSAAEPEPALPPTEGLLTLAADPGDVAAGAPVQASTPTRDDGTWWDRAVDWTVGGAEGLVDGAAGSLSAVPVLGDVAQGLADASRFQCDAAGGAAKAVGDMVSGIANMGLHPLETAKGVGTMLVHIPFSPLKPLAGLYEVAVGNQTIEESCARSPLDDLGGDLDFWKGVGGALIEPYQKALAEGRPGEAVGRGIVDIGSLFLNIGEVKAAGKVAEAAEAVSALSKADDAVKIASRVSDIGGDADKLARLGEQADDLAPLVSTSDDVANLNMAESATAVADQIGCEGTLGAAEGNEGLALAKEAEGGASAGHADDSVMEKMGEDGVAQPERSVAEATPERGRIPTPDEIRGSSPISIPDEAKVIQQTKDAGYEQIKFRWDDGEAKYEARWHTRTPGAPLEQGDTWVVERKIHGNATGRTASEQVMVGEGNWVQKYVWRDAIDARRAGTATPEQEALLTAGHHAAG